MGISYKKLWVLLIDRDIKKSSFRKELNLSSGTWTKLNKGEEVSLSKGTRSPRQLKNGDAFALEMEIKTIRYGLGSSCAFVIFYVDVEEETVYYLPLQDYFISKPELFDKLDNNKSQITVHVPCDNIVCENDFDLQQIAKSIYIDGPSRKLRKV